MTRGRAERRSADPADAPLRRDIRVLGDILGRILVEQEGQVDVSLAHWPAYENGWPLQLPPRVQPLNSVV